MTTIPPTNNVIIPAEVLPVRPWHELRDTGLLWLINRVILHPRGYALAIQMNPDGTSSGWNLVGDGTEPWQYGCDAESQAREDELFAKIKELLP